jgi:secreted trypsin-like serine protease
LFATPVIFKRGAWIATLLAAALFAALSPANAEARLERIVGGRAATLSVWPWVARVLIDNSNGIGACSGTVVAPDVVLTAGHCVFYASLLDVVTGTTSASSGGQMSTVSQVVRDPSFAIVGPNDFTDYDAALLKLTTPTSAPTVALATPGDSSLYESGTNVSIAGWGWETYASSTASATLQTGTLVVRGDSLCRSDSKVTFGRQLDVVDQFCAVSPTNSTAVCEGDSGGPVMATDANGARVEIGLTVSDSDNCSTREPDYFTNLAAISGWLTHEIRVLSGGSSTPQPLAGMYRGKTRQDGAVAITVAPSRTQVGAASMTVQLRCTRLSHLLTYTTRPRGSRYWPRRIGTTGGLRFKDSFRDQLGWQVAIEAMFTTHGTVNGDVTIAGGNQRDGTCRSGVVHWTAKRS